MAAPPKFVFENRPEAEIPQGADPRKPAPEIERGGVRLQRRLQNVDQVRVRYHSPVWKSQREIQAYLTGLFDDPHIGLYPEPMWVGALGEPEIECHLQFEGPGHGRMLLWEAAGCLQDARGRWWFFWVGDYFEQNHPKRK